MDLTTRSETLMFFTFPEDAHWNAEAQAVEFGVEIGEYRGVVGSRAVWSSGYRSGQTGAAVSRQRKLDQWRREVARQCWRMAANKS